MPDVPDLTSLTIMLILATAIIVPQIRLYDIKKRWIFRCAVICLAVVIYLIAVIPHLKTYPPTVDHTVYITNTGEKYHAGDCRHLRSSKIPITLGDAIQKGYGDCYHCATPAYRTEYITVTFRDLYPRESLKVVGLAALAISVYIGFHILLYWLSKRCKNRK